MLDTARAFQHQSDDHFDGIDAGDEDGRDVSLDDSLAMDRLIRVAR